MTPYEGQLYRITSPYFCAGIVVAQDGVILLTAPILRKRFVGTNIAYVRTVCDRERWLLETVPAGTAIPSNLLWYMGE